MKFSLERFRSRTPEKLMPVTAFSLNMNGESRQLRVGEKVVLPASRDNELSVTLNFLASHIGIDLAFPDGARVKHLWGKFNFFRETGPVLDKPLRHTVSIGGGREHDRVGKIPRTDLELKITAGGDGRQHWCLSGPDDSWVVWWTGS